MIYAYVVVIVFNFIINTNFAQVNETHKGISEIGLLRDKNKICKHCLLQL